MSADLALQFALLMAGTGVPLALIARALGQQDHERPRLDKSASRRSALLS